MSLIGTSSGLSGWPFLVAFSYGLLRWSGRWRLWQFRHSISGSVKRRRDPRPPTPARQDDRGVEADDVVAPVTIDATTGA
jgi:hypothetical protein